MKLQAGHLEGKRMLLREVVPADADGPYLRWMNDPQITRYLESRFRAYSAGDLRLYVQAQLEHPDTLFLALVLRDGARHIGNVKLGPIDRHHRRADIGILVGERDCWGRGYATEAIELLAFYALGILELNKLTAGAYASNVGSIRAFEKAGFRVEGVRRAHFLTDGRPEDQVLLGLVGTTNQPMEKGQ